MATAPWAPVPGSTYLRDTGGKQHLFVVLADPAVVMDYGQTPKILAVSITTLYAGVKHDPACVLQVGDHPFIQHESWAYYRRCDFKTEAELIALVGNMGCVPHAACSPALLHRLRISICQSLAAPQEFQDLLGCVPP